MIYGPRVPSVCLMAGSLSRDVLGSRDLKAYVVTELRRSVTLGLRTRYGTASGELAAGLDSQTAADAIITFLHVFLRSVRILDKRHEMQQQVEALIRGPGL
jgi:hypothetical protein